MRAIAAALGAGLVACCTSSPRPMQDVEPKPQTHLDGKEATVSPANAPGTATFTFISRRREHPPMSKLEVDVSLRNPGDRARWFLFPSHLDAALRPIATSAFGASVWSLPGSGNVVIAEFAGATSFWAIQLPPGAEVELHNLTISLAGELPTKTVSLEIITGDGFTLGGDVPAVWTETPATCEPRADATFAGAKNVREYHTPDLKARAIEIQGAERLSGTLTIPE
jgi:hypothetical protein